MAIPIRQRIYQIIEVSDGNDFWSSFYDYFMIAVVILSLVPLAFKQQTTAFFVVDGIAVTVFIIDYILSIATSDYRYGSRSWRSFLRYPVSFWGFIDLLSILPSITMLGGGFRLVRVVRMARALRVLRVIRAFRYSKSVNMIAQVMRNARASLVAVGTLAVAYILISALVMFNVEPDTFGNYLDAVYWATVTLTTIGYGDFHPNTPLGQVITVVSAIFGIAIVALPAGIIAAEFTNEITSRDTKSSSGAAERDAFSATPLHHPAAPYPLSCDGDPSSPCPSSSCGPSAGQSPAWDRRTVQLRETAANFALPVTPTTRNPT